MWFFVILTTEPLIKEGHKDFSRLYFSACFWNIILYYSVCFWNTIFLQGKKIEDLHCMIDISISWDGFPGRCNFIHFDEEKTCI